MSSLSHQAKLSKRNTVDTKTTTKTTLKNYIEKEFGMCSYFQKARTSFGVKREMTGYFGGKGRINKISLIRPQVYIVILMLIIIRYKLHTS